MLSLQTLIRLTGGCILHLSISVVILAVLFLDQVQHINNGISSIEGPLTLFLKVWNLPVSLFSFFFYPSANSHFWTKFEWGDFSFIQIVLTLLGAAIIGGTVVAAFSEVRARFFHSPRKAEQGAAANP
jgi:hypothetical protein